MPDNEVEDGIHNLFEVDNYSQRQHLSHDVHGSWSVINDNQWAGEQRQSVVPVNFNLNRYSLQKLDSLRGRGGESISVSYNPNCATLTPRPENNRSHSRSYECNTNGSLLGNQSFQTRLSQSGYLGEYTSYDQHNLTLRGLSILKSQQEYESGTDSPTLTANSERSEITEVSTDFNFLRGQQQLASGQQPGILQPGQMQQSGYNDMQLLQQQHLMFKQLQELQKQQQLQQLGDVRQQNPVNQLSAMSKQAAGGQFSPLNGTPINDASQMFMSWVQCGASSAAQGVANRLMFSPEQGQPLRSMGLVPQPLDVSLYGTPVGTARGNIGQFSHVQGIPQAQKSVVQSSGFSNPLLRDQFAVSPDPVSIPQGAFITSQGIPGKNMFGQVPNQGLNSGILSGNLQEGNSPQTNASVKEFNGRQEQTGWPLMQHKTTQQGPSQGMVPLDPMEEKILYNMDDNIWDSFGKRPDMGAVGFGNALENTDLSNSFPSLQSGSWSALMQSAVAEASSSDTGLQEEWSGLTFQNTEPSTDNQLSNFMESDNQQTGWVDNNLQSASSFSSKPLHMFNDSSMSSSFPGFQQSGIQFSVEHREGMRQDGSHESMEKSSKVTGEWMDCSPQQKPSTEGSQQVHSFMHLNNAWAGQIYQHTEGDADQQRIASHREDSQLNFSAAPNTVKAHQATSQHVSENNQSDYLGNHNISVDNNEKENMGKSSQQISNGPHIITNAYEGEGETYEKQEGYFQRQNSTGSYNSKRLTGGEQGHSGQLQFFGNSSSNVVSMEQGHLPHFRGNSRASEEVPSRGDFKSGGSDGSNVTAQPSQNMLELLQKVDQSRDDGTAKHFGSGNSNSLARVSEVEMRTPGTQAYNQSSASQGFGLRLAPPSQRLPNSSHFLSSHGSPLITSYPDSRQVNSELKEKNQTWVASPSSTQTSPPSYELSQRAHWEDKASGLGHTGNSSYLNMHGNSGAAYAPAPSYARNQTQMQFISSGPVASQSLQATVTSTASRYPPFNHAASQDTSQQISSSPLGQQFPVLEAVPASQHSVISGMSQQGEVSTRQHNVWRNVPIQRQPSVPEPPKVPSNLASTMDPSNTNMINAPKVGHVSSDLGAGSQQQISSELLDSSQTAGLLQGPKPLSKHNLDANDFHSGSLVAPPNQQDLHGIKNDYDNSLIASQRNLASVVHSLESSPSQSYSLLDQVQAMKSVETDPSKRLGQQIYEHNIRSGNPMDSGRNSGVELNSVSSREKTMAFLTESIEDPSAKALARPAFPERPTNEMVKFGQSDFHSQSGSSNLISNTMEQNQVNQHMAPSWFKQYGTLKNGQMLPMYDTKLAKIASGQFFLGKTSQNLHVHASLEGVDARQGGTVLPSTIPNLMGTERFSAPYVLPSDVINPSMAVTKPKKRKHATLELLPWHKEVMQGSERLQNMSMAEEEWAQATKQLAEKVEDEVEMIEDLQPMLRTKRRLILTTQLMQQLFRPAPEPILSADAASHYDTVTYFVSKFALGDACSLTYHTRNDLLLPKDNSNMIPEKLKTFDGTVSQQLSEVVEKLIARAKKIENDFQSVVKATSIVDIKVECQELERFAVINRFAKFHIRGQADASGTSSSPGTQRPLPQRYVTVVPMPRNLPEGLQCISL